jgi:tRNA A-37 threonylcarbamoyl transferase component Bud32
MGMSNSSSQKCPQCGASLPENAPAGLCPNCLMALNLKTETVFSGDSPAAQPPLPPGQIAPHFPQLEILECLGRGGMGVVYKARQKTLNRFVALKLLAPERVRDAKFAERFTREAQALAALNHPNIVTIYDFGQAGGFYFLLMEFVDGANLRQLLRARKFTPEEALAIVPPLCDALQFAHDRGIVHRDIKPENLLLDKAGRVKVADFGIAKMIEPEAGRADLPVSPDIGAAQQHGPTGAVGTPGYSAPEQKTDPQRVDSRADIYSLGVVFYEMLTGELPGKTIAPPSTKVQIDVRLDEIVLRALEKNPGLRYQQVSEVKTCVETIAATPRSSRREEAQTKKAESEKAESGKQSQSLVTSAATNQGARFSRTTIAGVIWAGFFLIVVLMGFASAAGLELRFVSMAISGPLILFGLTAPFGTTILGWIAVSQIRRSAGKLYGLWLAVFDGLLFPLLVLNALIIGLNIGLVLYAFSQLMVPASKFLFVLGALPALGAVPVIDFFISRRVWRAVNQPLSDATAGMGDTGIKPAPKNSTGAVLAIVSGVLVAGGLIVLLVAAGLSWSRKQVASAREVSIVKQLQQAALARQRAEESVAKVRAESVGSTNSDSSIIPVIQLQDVPLPATIDHFARQIQLNYVIEPALLAELERAPTVSIRWEKLTARQALTAILDSRDLQLIENPPTGVARIVRQTADASQQRINIIPAATQNLSFGPVIERVVADSKPHFESEAERTNALMMIDFDSGSLLAGSSAMWAADTGSQKSWMQTNGVDAMGVIPQVNGLVGLDMKAVKVLSSMWSNVSAVAIAEIVERSSSKDTTLLSADELLPSTWAFQTREGGMGILQITGFTENPRGVKIRYKLMQNLEAQKPKPETVTGQVTDQNGMPLANVRWRISAIEEWRDGQWELIHYSGIPQWTFTDAEGRFTLTFNGKQRFDLQFASSGEFAPGFVYEVSSETRDLKVVMKPGIPLRGTVKASNSNRIPGNVRVELMLPGRDVWYQQETITDADGHFIFYVCAPPNEPNKTIPAKWQISCAGTVMPFEVTTEKSIGMNLLVDARAEIIVNTNATITK